MAVSGNGLSAGCLTVGGQQLSSVNGQVPSSPSAAAVPTPLGATQQLPDSDTIKMFVGQVPRNMDETELVRMFEEFGTVYEVNVLRDKFTGVSKGCCFVTFMQRRAALEAQNHLHNVRTLAGMYHPLQMKPADSENRNERRLFVGMLSRQCDETAVRSLFARFGGIDECSVLRDTSGHSRGCAFVTFVSRQCAFAAIKAMHHAITMPGCSAPLVVKFADTQRDKESRRAAAGHNQSLMPGAGGVGSWPGAPFTPQYLQLLQQLTTSSGGGGGGGGRYGAGSSTGGVSSLTALVAAAAAAAAAANNNNNSQNSNTGGVTASGGGGGNSSSASSDVVQQFGQLAAALAHAQLSLQQQQQQQQSSPGGPAGRRDEGPDDANLFIYHLPQEFTDTDLAHMFMPFGSVISCKVFVDKFTNLSKCFGFVSYGNAASAQAAIQAMNGFQVGAKRLKVQLKRAKDGVVSASGGGGMMAPSSMTTIASNGAAVPMSSNGTPY